MKKPRSLPDWFDIKNYRYVESFSPEDWHANLEIRFDVLSACKAINDIQIPLEAKNEYRDFAKEYIDDLYSGGAYIHVLRSVLYPHHRSVSPLTNSDASTIMGLLQANLADAGLSLPDIENLSDNGLNKLDQRIQAFLEGEFKTLDSEAVLVINLNANDDQIAADFKGWLEKIRQQRPLVCVTKPFNENEYKDWCEYKIIPYLDLKIWSEFSGKKLTNAVIGNAIFPDDFDIDTTERVRRTTKPKADWLMQYSVLQALFLQIKEEEREE